MISAKYSVVFSDLNFHQWDLNRLIKDSKIPEPLIKDILGRAEPLLKKHETTNGYISAGCVVLAFCFSLIVALILAKTRCLPIDSEWLICLWAVIMIVTYFTSNYYFTRKGERDLKEQVGELMKEAESNKMNPVGTRWTFRKNNRFLYEIQVEIGGGATEKEVTDLKV